MAPLRFHVQDCLDCTVLLYGSFDGGYIFRVNASLESLRCRNRIKVNTLPELSVIAQ
jgi:hypothetical protein